MEDTVETVSAASLEPPAVAAIPKAGEDLRAVEGDCGSGI